MRTGITTGTCAAGAAKACALYLAGCEVPETVCVKNLQGHVFRLKAFREGEYFCVVKYSGDDRADVTDGVKVLARVDTLDGEDSISFCAGEGVGTVTLPGLKIPPGEPAINPVPREMITLVVREILPRKSLMVTVSIPDGEKIAKRTFNPRLGITGGLSILGTTGIVKPMNEQALLDSLTLELEMIYALGFREVYITFAGTGENFTRQLFHIQGRNIIQCANYPGYVLDECARLGFTRATICGHPGKLLKVAAGSFNTHSHVSGGSIEALCTQLAILGASPDLVARVYSSNTTREAIEVVRGQGLGVRVWRELARIVSAKCRERANIPVSAVFIDGEGQVLGSWHDA
ncbi:MAG: cobalamin biosynthesis protein CbiD [Synergistaceae bacterium]|nr:cobalamin biosynthesis protein CbiD [Synergistaceae bacterium]